MKRLGLSNHRRLDKKTHLASCSWDDRAESTESISSRKITAGALSAWRGRERQEKSGASRQILDAGRGAPEQLAQNALAWWRCALG